MEPTKVNLTAGAPIIDSALEAAAKLLEVIDKAIPSDELRAERFKLRFPKRFERIEKRAMEIKLRKLRELHQFMIKNGLSAETVTKYVGGDINTQTALEQMGTK